MTDYYLKLTSTEIDESLDNAREPTAHAATHKSGGTDAIKITELAVADNVTTHNATTARPGLCPILPGSTTTFLRGDGAFSLLPATSGGSGSSLVYGITIGTTGSGADYECPGTSADATTIQTALNAAPNGSKVYFLPGTYYFGSVSQAPSVTVTGKQLDIEGLGEVIFSGSAYPLIAFQGEVILTNQLITANTAYDTTESKDYVTLSSGNAALCAAGDIIRLQNSDDWPTDYSGLAGLKTGETYLIDSISSTKVYLVSFLIREYTTAKTSKVRVYRPSKIKIKNIKFLGGYSTAKLGGLSFRYCSESSIEDCVFESNGNYGICLYSCINVTVSGSTVRDCNMAGNGYGIDIADGSADIRIENNRIENCRHCIAGACVDMFNVNSGIIISGNTFMTSGITDSNIIDAHTCVLDYTIVGNTFYCHTDPAASRVVCAFYDGCQHSTFVGNTVYNGLAVRRRDNIDGGVRLISGNRVINGALFRESSGNANSAGDSLIITNNVCTDCPEDAPNAVSIINEYYTNVVISNNIISGCTSTAILFRLNSENTTSLVVSGNNISNSSAFGIAVQHPESGSELNCIISNNMLKNVVSYGIVLTSTVGANITGNSIFDVSGTSTGIYESGATYSNINNNVIHGCTNAVGSLGTGSVSVNNMTVP